MMRMKVLAAMFAVSAVSMIAGAKDTTWIGGESGYISDASNWDDGVPAGGDKVIFNKSVSLSNNTSEATFLMGEGGLEFSIAANCTVTDHVSYSGVGDLKLTGGGVWNFFGGIKVGSSYSVGLFTGNVEVVNGTFRPGVNTWYRYCLGGNRNDVKIRVHPGTGGTLAVTKYQTILCNDVVFVGGDDAESVGLSMSQSSYIRGDLYSDCDVRINSGWAVESNNKNGLFVETSNSYQVYNRGRVFASGKTLFVECTSKGQWFVLPAEVNGSIVKSGVGNLELSGVSTNVANYLELSSATNVMTSTARWYGTNVVVKNSGTVLELNSPKNLSVAARLSVGNGAKIHINSNAVVTVKECAVDGTPLSIGEYDSANLSDTISGNGKIQVVGAVKTWVGGATGSISDPENWDDGLIPASGDSLLFLSNVKLAEEEFNFGANGLTIIVDTDRKLECHVEFKGEGGILKRGHGTLDYRKQGFFSGDVDVKEGVFQPGINEWTRFSVGGNGNNVKIRVRLNTGGRLDMTKHQTQLCNDVIFTGGDGVTSAGMSFSDSSFVRGDLHSDSDVRISSGWAIPSIANNGLYVETATSSQVHKRGRVFASGKTLYVACTYKGHGFAFPAEVNGSIVKSGVGNLEISGVSTNAANRLELHSATNILTAAAYWGGTNITVAGSQTVLRLFGKDNLSENASVSLNEGGLLDISGNFLVRVAAMSVDGVALANGIYRASNCASISGAGAVKVGTVGMVLTFR